MKIKDREVPIRLLVVFRRHVNGNVTVIRQKAAAKLRVQADSRSTEKRGGCPLVEISGISVANLPVFPLRFLIECRNIFILTRG